MSTLDPSDYPPAIAQLLQRLPLAPLGPGHPVEDVRGKLDAIGAAFPPGADRDLVAACRAGLWLAFNFLDEAHEISQDLATVEGSYWHALMHRREPDFTNSKYWFRSVGTHPIFDALSAAAHKQAAGASGPAALLARQTHWDALAFVDLCQMNEEPKSPDDNLCRHIQHIEWSLLFAYCYKKAAGSPL
jgi:hypothetical protein